MFSTKKSNDSRHASQPTEDLPQMRSVMLMPASPSSALPPLRAPTFSKRVLPPLKHLLPPAPKSRAAATAPVLSRALQTDPWKVKELKPLPEFYLLERTNVYVSGTSPGMIAQRIVSCFNKEAVLAKYNSDEASVKAETSDKIRFRVRMFSDCGKVVIEVQRRAGCGYGFHQMAKAILLTAKGSSGMKRGPPKQFSVPESCCRRLKVSEGEEEDAINTSLSIVSSMSSKNNYYETRELAMESLLSLSKKSKQGLVARKIIGGDLLDVLICLIQNEQKVIDKIDEEHFSVMRRHALTILANCLDSLEQSNELFTVLKEKKAVLLSDDLLRKLQELDEKDVSPHDSRQAARCLQPIYVAI